MLCEKIEGFLINHLAWGGFGLRKPHWLTGSYTEVGDVENRNQESILTNKRKLKKTDPPTFEIAYIALGSILLNFMQCSQRPIIRVVMPPTRCRVKSTHKFGPRAVHETTVAPGPAPPLLGNIRTLAVAVARTVALTARSNREKCKALRADVAKALNESRCGGSESRCG